MEDEGYNVEWSQELKLGQAASEYVNAWVLIHILRRVLGQEQLPFDTIFNMSVGYNLEGIQSAPMTHFMDQMVDASSELAEIQSILKASYPEFADIAISPRLVNSVTLSTMHGCPPDEIEKIARYLIESRGLHTTVKLNPTLLGKQRVLHILQQDLGYAEIDIPDKVFEHDLQYARAIDLVRSLQQVSASRGLSFGVKLSNTLPVANHRSALPGGEMYMSGRALYPITMNLFAQLDEEFGGDLKVSFSAGADALNVSQILAAGAYPVTVASDLLKPGGYSRMLQYLDAIEADMQRAGAASLEELRKDRRAAVKEAAAEALVNPRYKKGYPGEDLPKVSSGLGFFDCTTAPCSEQCAVCQDIPAYNRLIAQGQPDQAFEVILARNPLPNVTGYVCTQLCRTHCLRSQYDQAVEIRRLKRYAAQQGKVQLHKQPGKGKRVAIIGSGPSGLSAAYFLALNGVDATIFEAKPVPGGMLRMIPSFRLPDEIIQADVERITGLGVRVELSHPVTGAPERLLEEGFAAVYVAAGFQQDAPLEIQGIEGQGVFAALDLLARVRQGEPVDLGSKVLVVGGGDTAMDAARVSGRLSRNPATIVYRRSRQEMPASKDELEGAFEEGAILEELVTPLRVVRDAQGRVTALECLRNRLAEPGPDGRRKPVAIPGSNFQLPADAVVLAVGQLPQLGFMGGSQVAFVKNGSISAQPETGFTGVAHVYAGGDVVDGPDSIIAACADGKRAAQAICADLGIAFQPPFQVMLEVSAEEIEQIKVNRAHKTNTVLPESLPATERGGFALVEPDLTAEQARQEAARCLSCDALCDKCVDVCPNRANRAYALQPVELALPRLAVQDGKLIQTGTQAWRVSQARQIVHIDDFCNECGNCATFCVHQGKPFREKPRIFLQEADYVKEERNAFFFQNGPDGLTLRRREAGRESRLVASGPQVVYEDERFRLVFSASDFVLKESALKSAYEGELAPVEAAEMWLVLNGVGPLLPKLAR
jgi:putative selenate reductase